METPELKANCEQVSVGVAGWLRKAWTDWGGVSDGTRNTGELKNKWKTLVSKVKHKKKTLILLSYYSIILIQKHKKHYDHKNTDPDTFRSLLLVCFVFCQKKSGTICTGVINLINRKLKPLRNRKSTLVTCVKKKKYQFDVVHPK